MFGSKLNKGTLENEIEKAIRSRSRLHLLKPKVYNEEWQNILGEQLEEILYAVGSTHTNDILLIFSSLDSRTGKPIKNSSGIRIGFFHYKNTLGEPIRYAEFKKLKRTSNVLSSLNESLKDAIDVLHDFKYFSMTNYKWDVLGQPSVSISDYGKLLENKFGQPLKAIRYLGEPTKLTHKQPDGNISYRVRIADSISGKKFVAFTGARQEVAELIVDTKKRRIVKALDYQGNDIANKFIHLVTEDQELVVTEKHWFIKDIRNRDIKI